MCISIFSVGSKSYQAFYNNDLETVLLYEVYCEMFNKAIVPFTKKVDAIYVEFDTNTNQPIREISNDTYVDLYLRNFIFDLEEDN